MTLRTITMIAALALFGASCGGCQDDEKSDSSEKVEKTAQKEDDSAAEEDVHPYMQMREAYGLPFPPEVAYVKKGDNFIEVGTRLQIDELEAYFKKRLVDYEYIRPDERQLRIVGLRSYMPSIWIFFHAINLPLSVRYVRPAPPVGKAAPGGLEVASSVEHTADATSRTKGSPVNLRTPDGKLLAPGAKWGESYTPPPGSPLHQKRFRANFGKPFGEWIPN